MALSEEVDCLRMDWEMHAGSTVESYDGRYVDGI